MLGPEREACHIPQTLSTEASGRAPPLLMRFTKRGPRRTATGTINKRATSINKRANKQAPWTNEHGQRTSKQSPRPTDKQAWTLEQVSSTPDQGA